MDREKDNPKQIEDFVQAVQIASELDTQAYAAFMGALGYALSRIDEIPLEKRTTEHVLEMVVERGELRSQDIHEIASPAVLDHSEVLKEIVRNWQRHWQSFRILDTLDHLNE